MSDPVFTITSEHALAEGGLPQREQREARSPGGVVAMVAAVVARPDFCRLTIDTQPVEQQLALAA
jgi:hypothetical protein